MTSIWLNRLSMAALIVACVLALWLFMAGAAISFFMSDRDPFPNAEAVAFWLLFVGPLAGAGLAFASRALGLALMTMSLAAGLLILRSTGCLGEANLSGFTCDIFRWQHVVTVGLTFLSLLFRRWSRRQTTDLAAGA